MFLPETRNAMASSVCCGTTVARLLACSTSVEWSYERVQGPSMPFRPRSRSTCCAHRRLLGAPTLHRGRNPHGLAIFCDRPAGDVDSGLAQLSDDCIVGQHILWAFRLNELPYAVPDRFGRVGFAAISRGNGRGEKIFELEYSAIGCQVLVGRHPRDGGFVHLDCVRHRLEIERTQVLHAQGEKSALLANDLAREDR